MASRRPKNDPGVVRRKVLEVMKSGGKECYTTSELFRKCGLRASSDVNPVLYELKREGVVDKIQEKSPPMWQLRSGSGVGHGPRGVQAGHRPPAGLGRGCGRGWSGSRDARNAAQTGPRAASLLPRGRAHSLQNPPPHLRQPHPQTTPTNTQAVPTNPPHFSHNISRTTTPPWIVPRGGDPPRLPSQPVGGQRSGSDRHHPLLRVESKEPAGQRSGSDYHQLLIGGESNKPGGKRSGNEPSAGPRQSLSESPSDLSLRLLEVLVRGNGQTASALELAKQLGYQTRSVVNPYLYQLEEKGAVVKVEGHGAPRWYLASEAGRVVPDTRHSGTNVPPGMPPLEDPALDAPIAHGSVSVHPSHPYGAGELSLTPPVSVAVDPMEGVSSDDEKDGSDRGYLSSVDLSHIPTDHVRERILAVLDATTPTFLTALELARAVGGGRTRSSVVPYLEALFREGLVGKNAESRPETWCLATSLRHGGEAFYPQSTSGLVSASVLDPQSTSGLVSASVPTSAMGSLNIAGLADMNRNPITVLTEYCQAQRHELAFHIVREYGPPHCKNFVLTASFGGLSFEAHASNKKEARRNAADLALQYLMKEQVIIGQPTTSLTVAPSPSPSSSSSASSSFPPSFHDEIARMSHEFFVQVQSSIDVAQPGRKVIAAFVMENTASGEYHPVAIGSGTRCITGDQMSLEGLVVNDSHAEVVARKSLMRFLYRQLTAELRGCPDTIFTASADNPTLFRVRDNFKFHLYISTAPCGDGAQFSRSDATNQDPPSDGEHHPTMTSKLQGVLRTKMEGGEGTIPIGDARPQTWDGILAGGRLRTMSCSDKVARWNVLGLQGALLSQFMEPVYMSSLTLGSLHHHGHLSRAVCCRFADLSPSLPPGYRVNHAPLGRVRGGDEMKRHTEKTSHFSLNWAADDETGELNNGVTGKPVPAAGLPKAHYATSRSRICKLSLFAQFISLCEAAGRTEIIAGKSYKAAKEMAVAYEAAKRVLYELCERKGYGTWMRKPVEQEMFDAGILQKLDTQKQLFS